MPVRQDCAAPRARVPCRGRTSLALALGLAAFALALPSGSAAQAAPAPVAGSVTTTAVQTSVEIGVTLNHLEQLAARQPRKAQEELDALLRQGLLLDERASVQLELVRILIADAQNRSEDVLHLAGAVHERLLLVGDARIQMQVEHARWGALFDLGRFAECWTSLEDELRYARAARDDDLIAQALADRAYYLIKRSDFEPAAAAIAEAQSHVKGMEESADVAYYSGMLAQNIGDWNLAISHYQTAQERFRMMADVSGEADALISYAMALYEVGRYADAQEALAGAAHAYQEIGSGDGQAMVDSQLALVRAGLKDMGAALRLNAQAIEVQVRLNRPVRLAHSRVERAGLLASVGRSAEALALLEQVRAFVLGQDDLKLRSLYHRTAARCFAQLGRFREAYDQQERYAESEQRRTEQLVARQLAVQRGRMESERLMRENALLRTQAAASERALSEANRAGTLQNLALVLGALIVLGSLLAIGRQRALTRQIARIARTDALTGMLNRGHVLELGQRTMQRCRRDGQSCAILMLDVDRFKEINDRYGHVAGDAALRAIAHALTSCLRPNDQIGRYGGEEFAVILPGADAREAHVVAERLRMAVENLKPDWAPGAEPLTVSGGIAIASEDVSDFTELLIRADKALYRAKDAGRNRMELHGSAAALAPA